MTKYNSEKHHRRSIRLKGYDYTQPGAYFVTICTHDRECLFGEVIDGDMVLNDYGQIVHDEWLKSPQIRKEIDMDVFVVMPNHVHGIVWIVPIYISHAQNVGVYGLKPLRDGNESPTVGACGLTPLPGLTPKSLGACINGFKVSVTKQINQLRNMPCISVWQRNYYEHVIRHDETLHAVRQYIEQNPMRWHLDRYNEHTTERDPQVKILWNLLTK